MSGDSARETLLRGGRIVAGVVQIGDTVHKPPTPNSDFVRRLLHHLHIHGFDAAPRAIGVDDVGRDILSFIPGDVPAELSFHADHVLSAAARLIGRFHDASARLVDSPAMRRIGIEVVCHNDLSPCNFVFVGGRPAAVIDFDAASPGTRLHDLGYAAWLWLDLGRPDVAPDEQRRRLSLFLSAYGFPVTTRADVVQAILRRQAVAAARGVQIGERAMSAWADACREWTLRHRAVLEAGP